MKLEDLNLEGYEEPTPLEFDWNVLESEYRADPRLNFHRLANFRRDPRAFREGYFDDREESAAMRFGTALHALVLQGRDAFDAKVATFDPPINPRTKEPYGTTSQTYLDALAKFQAKHEGMTLISTDERDLVEKMRDEANFHPVAPRVLGRAPWARAEVPVAGEIVLDDGSTFPVKGLIDRYCESGLVDIKTTAQFDDGTGRDKFRYNIYDYKYLVQLAFYHCILTDCYGAPFVPAWIVAFEKNAPNRVAVYSVAPQVLSDSRVVAKAWVKSYKEATERKSFPSRFDRVQTITEYNASKDLY